MSWPAGIGPGLYKQIVVFGNLRVQKFLGQLLRVHTFLLKKLSSQVLILTDLQIFFGLFSVFLATEWISFEHLVITCRKW